MHAHSLIVGAIVVTTSAAAEPVTFHTSHFADATAVSLSLLSNRLSSDGAYDFDVTIGLLETGRGGFDGYRDRGGHPARVRCGTPASVFVGGTDYPVGMPLSSHDAGDWKRDLWRAVCSVPTS